MKEEMIIKIFIYLYLSNVAVFGSVVGGARHDVDTPVAEDTELVGQQQCGEVERKDVPEVAVEESCEADVPAVPVPQSHGGLAVVAFPGVHAILLRPEVGHVLHSVHERVGEHGAEVGRQTCAENLHWHYGVVAGPPDD